MLQKKTRLLNPKYLKYLRWLDFQYLTILLGLKRIQREWAFPPRKILDVGAGSWNYRRCFQVESRNYITYDPYTPADVHDLKELAGQQFDLILLIEVLEHVADPAALLTQLRPLLTEQGSIIISAPWAARLHYCPQDYGRFSQASLALIAAASGFHLTSAFYRGHTIQTLANKIIYFLGQGLLRFNGFWPCYVLLSILAGPFFLFILLGSYLCLGVPPRMFNQDDPLGLMAVLQKKP